MRLLLSQPSSYLICTTTLYLFVMTQPTRCSKRLSKSTKKDPEFLYPDLQRQLKDWHFLAEEPENNSTFKDAAFSAQGSKDPSTVSVARSSLQRQQDHVTRDLSQDLKLVPLQKEKLSLELEVLHLQHTSNSSQ